MVKKGLFFKKYLALVSFHEYVQMKRWLVQTVARKWLLYAVSSIDYTTPKWTILIVPFPLSSSSETSAKKHKISRINQMKIIQGMKFVLCLFTLTAKLLLSHMLASLS
jgi:hypothetical protein